MSRACDWSLHETWAKKSRTTSVAHSQMHISIIVVQEHQHVRTHTANQINEGIGNVFIQEWECRRTGAETSRPRQKYYYLFAKIRLFQPHINQISLCES